MPKHKHTYNVRLVKATLPYSVQEAAALFGVHKNAVLRWLKEGLQADREKRPFLIRGSELVRFLTVRQQSRKRKCALAEFFCCKCHTPREAQDGAVDVVIENQNWLRVTASCAVCGTRMNKTQALGNLQNIQNCFHVRQLARRHIIERDDPSVNSDKEAQP